MQVRKILPDDRPVAEAFLLEHLETSLYLLNDLQRGGLVYEGQPYQAEFFGVFRDQTLIGLAAHTWMDTLLLQAPSLEALSALEAGLPRLLTRPVHGILGPRDQCLELMDQLDLDHTSAELDQDEPVYSLELARLRRPMLLDTPRLRVRATRELELEMLIEWRLSYLVEAWHLTPSPRLVRRAADEVHRAHADARSFVLEVGAEVVACCTFTAQTAEAVQIGGIFTPAGLRGRGYGTTLTAGALEHARYHLGHRQAVLFIDDANRPALSGCESLGFQRVGRYSFTLWELS
jgi:RimJ/RimL family protein N-acetyltransferase